MAARFAELCVGKIGLHALAKMSGIPYSRVLVAWRGGPLLLSEAKTLLSTLNTVASTAFTLADVDLNIIDYPATSFQQEQQPR